MNNAQLSYIFMASVCAKQTCASHHRVGTDTSCIFVCYVCYARFSQMLRACAFLRLRSVRKTEFAVQGTKTMNIV